MLVEHVADRDAGGNALVVMQRADGRAVGVAVIDEAQVFARDHAGGVADRGIGRHASLETVAAASVLHDLAHDVDARDRPLRRVRAAHVLALDLGDHADQAARAGVDAHELADRRARLRARRDRNGDPRLAAAHAEDRAERLRQTARADSGRLR